MRGSLQSRKPSTRTTSWSASAAVAPATVEGVVGGPDDLHVLLRHRPRSTRRLRCRLERRAPTAPQLRGLRLALGTDTLAGCTPSRYAPAWKRAWKRQTATGRRRRSRRASAKWSIYGRCARRRSRPQQRPALHTREVAGSKPAAPIP